MDSNTIARLCTSRALLLEAPDTETTTSRHPARVVECRKDEHLLLRLARGERPLPLGTAVSVLVPADGAIWRYETTVLASGGNVRLAWPERVERLSGRRYPRADVVLPLRVRAPSAGVVGTYTLDLSEGGVRFAYSAGLAVGTVVQLSLQLPGGNTETETRIAWREHAESDPEDPHYLVGGTFLDLSEAAQRRIGSLVKLMKPPLLDASHAGAAH